MTKTRMRPAKKAKIRRTRATKMRMRLIRGVRMKTRKAMKTKMREGDDSASEHFSASQELKTRLKERTVEEEEQQDIANKDRPREDEDHGGDMGTRRDAEIDNPPSPPAICDVGGEYVVCSTERRVSV